MLKRDVTLHSHMNYKILFSDHSTQKVFIANDKGGKSGTSTVRVRSTVDQHIRRYR